MVDTVYSDLQKQANVKAKILAQDLVAAQALGRNDLADQLVEILKNRQTESGFDTGAYSLFSNLPAFDLLGRAGKLSVVNAAYARDYILSNQLTQSTVPAEVYGAWGGSWTDDKQSTHYFADFMATAQAVRALHYLDPRGSDPSVQAAIYNGLAWMQKQQQPDGSFVAGWDDPVIDTCEAILTAKTLGQDPATWQSSSGKSPVDYLQSGAVVNADGSLGSSKNAMDATWALNACILLNIKPTVWRFYLDPSSNTLNIGAQQQFRAVWQDAYGQSEVTQWAAWSVADSSIAGVDDSVYKGLVTAKSAGQTVVKAVYEGLTASAALTVKSPAGGGTAAAATVGMAAVGANGELLYGPSYVTVTAGNKWGLTALGALDASGVSYHTSTWSWGILVDEIAGQANSGMAGWMYTVNGQIPSFGPEKYNIKEGDKIIWYYSKSMDQQPPKWEDLVKQAGSGATSAATAVQQVTDLLSGLQSGKVASGQAIAGISELLDKLKAADMTKELKDKLAEAAKTLSQAVAKLPEKTLSVRVEGDQARVTVDGDAVKDQVSTIKKAAGLMEKLEKIGVSDTAGLIPGKITVELPADLTGKSGFTVALPAGAVQDVISGNLDLAVKGGEVSLALPPEALKTVIAAGPGVSQVEVSVEKVDERRVGIFRGASLTGKKLLNLEVNAVTPEGKREIPKAGFAKKVTVTFSLEGVELSKIDKSRLSVYRQKRDGSWEFIGGRLSQDGKTFSFETDHMSLYALLEFKNPFKDIEGHWAQETIELMAMRLIARGVSEDAFAPDRQLTRAQFAAFLVRAFGLEAQNQPVRSFKDVPPDYWGCRAIEAAYQAGIVSGVGGGSFDPERCISREEMAVMIARLLGKFGAGAKLTDSQVQEIFTRYADSGQVSGWAREGVATCVSRGIINGRSATTLAPLGEATRAEAVVVVQKLLQLLGRL